MNDEIDDTELEYIEIPDDRTDSEREYDRQIERLDSFFSAIQPGVTLLVERLKPTWCSGLLEEITVSDELIDLSYFIDNWGGELLLIKVRGKRGQLQGSYKVPLHSYPPLRYGARIYPYDKSERFKDVPDKAPPSQPVVVNQPKSFDVEKLFASIPAILPFIMKWLENNETRRQHDMAMLLQMANKQSGIGDISQLSTAMVQLNDLYKKTVWKGDSGASGGGDVDFLPQALDVLKMVMSPQQQNQQSPKGHLSPPKTNGPPNVHNVTQLPTTARQQLPTDLAANIATLGSSEAAETIIDALSRMDPSKRNSAIEKFLIEYNATMNSDEDEDGEDYEQEDDDQRGYS